MEYYPLKLKPVLKDILWGGTSLACSYRQSDTPQKIAESWVLSVRPDGDNTISNGAYSGMTLSAYCASAGLERVCGTQSPLFPILIKLIDAHDKLSVQVHPDDGYAHAHGLDSGKTEMWWILDAKDGASIVYGFKDGPLPPVEELKRLTAMGQLEPYLNVVPVKKGDCFFLPPGLVHAIGEGIVLAEVQQNSNTTYRLFDYHRKGPDGKLRDLHIDEAFDVLQTQLHPVPGGTGQEERDDRLLVDCDYFSAQAVSLQKSSMSFVPRGQMVHILCVGGSGVLTHRDGKERMETGDSYLFPAAMQANVILDADESLQLLVSVAK